MFSNAIRGLAAFLSLEFRQQLKQIVPLQVLGNMYDSANANAVEHYHAFYSSELRGIVTDPALMVVHVDDHMVHRGHAVFDTAIIVDGYAYQLEEHLERFQQSAVIAGIPLPVSIEQMSRTILETAAASRQINGETTMLAALSLLNLP